MSIHIREFSIENPNILKCVRQIGNTDIADENGNKLCIYGSRQNFNPCFDNCPRAPLSRSAVIKTCQISSWPLYFDGLTPDGAPPNGCSNCCEDNKNLCLKNTPSGIPSCIFSVSKSKVIRPQFVFLGKNWSADIANHQVDTICWGDGHNYQAKALNDTILEGGYFTDFIKGKEETDFNLPAYLTQKIPHSRQYQGVPDQMLNGMNRFDVFLSIFKQELNLLSMLFDLTGTDKYIIIWGKSLFDDLNLVCKRLYNSTFASLFPGYKVRFFGTHYHSSWQGMPTIPMPDRKQKTIRRIYETSASHKADQSRDSQGYDFEVLPNKVVLKETVVMV